MPDNGDYETIFMVYADCGTGGLLKAACDRLGVEMVEGPHCYAFFEGNSVFAARSEEEFDAFYLTDFLVRQFEAFVWRPMGLDRHPELRDMYFGNYSKLVYQAQNDDPALDAKAEDCARRLGLAYEPAIHGLWRPCRGVEVGCRGMTPDTFSKLFAVAFGRHDSTGMAGWLAQDAQVLTLTGAVAEGAKAAELAFKAEFSGTFAMARLVTAAKAAANRARRGGPASALRGDRGARRSGTGFAAVRGDADGGPAGAVRRLAGGVADVFSFGAIATRAACRAASVTVSPASILAISSVRSAGSSGQLR